MADAVRKEEEAILIEAEIIDKESECDELFLLKIYFQTFFKFSVSGRSADALNLAQAKPSAIAIAGEHFD
jgi:hypothetical protein